MATKLPKHIAAQVAEAEVLERELSGTPDPQNPAEPAAEPEAKATDTPDPAVTDEPKASPAEGEQHRSDPPKADPREDSVEVWRARYNSLRGLFEQQVPYLQQRVKDITSELEQLRAAPKPAATDPALQPTGKKRVTEKDVETFGGDLLDVIARKSEEVAEQVAAKYEAKVAQLEAALAKATGAVQQVAQNQVQNAKEKFFSTLNTQLPNWVELQNSDACQEWLGEPVPGTDLTWDDALKSAAAKADPAKALSVFRQFLKDHPHLDPAQRATQQQATQKEVQRQVAPPKSGTSAPSAPAQKRIYSSDEYEQETRKIIRLQKAGKFEQAAQIETELNAAMADGRISP